MNAHTLNSAGDRHRKNARKVAERESHVDLSSPPNDYEAPTEQVVKVESVDTCCL